MAGRVVRLICIVLMSMWLTSKVIAFSPLIAIPLIGATIVYMINEIGEIKSDNIKNKKAKKVKKKATVKKQ